MKLYLLPNRQLCGVLKRFLLALLCFWHRHDYRFFFRFLNRRKWDFNCTARAQCPQLKLERKFFSKLIWFTPMTKRTSKRSIRQGRNSIFKDMFFIKNTQKSFFMRHLVKKILIRFRLISPIVQVILGWIFGWDLMIFICSWYANEATFWISIAA